MTSKRYPVVLVHGWKSGPEIWRELTKRLEKESIPYWNFSFTGMEESDPVTIALALKDYIRSARQRMDYYDYIDIICHSTGGFIVRYLLEVIDGELREEKVRFFVGIGPANNGSAMAELFNDPEHGPAILSSLAGLFVPKRYDPAEDAIVQGLRPKSRETSEILASGFRDDINYRVIVSSNNECNPGFFPPFNGKTWVYTKKGSWEMTFLGDGVVAHIDSFVQGAGVDVLPGDREQFISGPFLYCHILLPKNKEVIDRILEYLTDSKTQPQFFC
ncbi:MAG: acetyltransferase [Methanomicrobiaceae archaeon]|nr:acetyltransferase [Methanomicrobiaceae archaeon]